MKSSDNLFLDTKLYGYCFPQIWSLRLHHEIIAAAAAAAAKSLQPCLTLCDPIVSSPPGSSIPGILQARTLGWVAISSSNEIITIVNFTDDKQRHQKVTQLVKDKECVLVALNSPFLTVMLY